MRLLDHSHSASMPRRGVLAGAVDVGEEGALGGSGESSFQGPEGFVAAVPGVASAHRAAHNPPDVMLLV